MIVRGTIHHRLDHRLIPHHTIGKFYAVDLVIRNQAPIDRIRSVIVDKGNLLVSSLELENHGRADLKAQHIRIGNTGTETQRIGGAQQVGVVDGILPIPAVEDIHVIACIAGQKVVSAATCEHIIAEVSPQAVVEDVAHAIQIGHAIKRQTLNVVIERTTHRTPHKIIALTRRLGNRVTCVVDFVIVVTGTTDQGVSPRPADELIVARSSIQPVCPGITRDVIGLGVAGRVDIPHPRQVQPLDVVRQGDAGRAVDRVVTFVRRFDHRIIYIVHDVGIVVRATRHDVRADAAVQVIVAQAAVEEVDAALAQQRVIVSAAIEVVVATPAHQLVVARFPIQDVVALVQRGQGGPGARVAKHRIDAKTANQNVVAAPADQLVVAVAAIEIVVAVMQARQVGFIVGVTPQLVSAVAAYQGVVLAASQQVVVVRTAVQVIIAVVQSGQVGFGLIVPIKLVVAGSAKQAIVPTAADNAVDTRPAIQHVVAVPRGGHTGVIP